MSLTLGLLVGAVALPAGAQACEVSEIYQEAFDEHQRTLLGMSVRLNTGGGALTDIDGGAVNYKLLMSMARFHRDMRDELPACAQPLNTAALDAINAAQDALSMLFLTQLDGGELYTDDLEDAIASFREALGQLNFIQGNQQVTSS